MLESMMMETPEGLVHILSLSGAAREAVLELAGIVLGGWLEGGSVVGEHFGAALTPSPEEGHIRLEVCRTSTGWLPPNEGFPVLFQLCATLGSAGWLQEVQGPWASWLSSGGTRKGPLAFLARPSVGVSDLEPRQAHPGDLAEIFRALGGSQPVERKQHTPDFREAFPSFQSQAEGLMDCLLQHRGGLIVRAQGLRHRILAEPFALPSQEITAINGALQEISGVPLTLLTTRKQALDLTSQLRSFGELKKAFSPLYRPFLDMVKSELDEVEMHSDYGRYPRQPVQSFSWTAADQSLCEVRHDPVSWELLAEHGVPRVSVLRFASIPPYREKGDPSPGWFVAACGPQRLWCESTTGLAIWSEQPAAVYQLSPTSSGPGC